MNDTELIFDNIKDNGEYLNPELIHSVYMPVHKDEGGAGRIFGYDYTLEDYHKLVKSILEHKPITITFPQPDLNVIRYYLELGVRRFMVSEWDDAYNKLKGDYPDVQIIRSIVGNSYNEEIDYRFDGVVLAYTYLTDLELLKKIRRDEIEVIVIPNHVCKASCKLIDKHSEFFFDEENREKVPEEFICPEGKNFFIPREVLYDILPYVDVVKLVERTKPSAFYENHLLYYTYGVPLNYVDFEENVQNQLVANNYFKSGLRNLDCRFNCEECEEKCY